MTEGDLLSGCPCRRKLVGNPVMIAPLALPPLPREQLGPLPHSLGLPEEGVAVNTEVPLDAGSYPLSPSVATEFVG